MYKQSQEIWMYTEWYSYVRGGKLRLWSKTHGIQGKRLPQASLAFKSRPLKFQQCKAWTCKLLPERILYVETEAVD